MPAIKFYSTFVERSLLLLPEAVEEEEDSQRIVLGPQRKSFGYGCAVVPQARGGGGVSAKPIREERVRDERVRDERVREERDRYDLFGKIPAETSNPCFKL